MKDKELLNIPVISQDNIMKPNLNSALKMLGKSMLFFVLLIAVASCSGDVGLQGIPGEDGVDGSAGEDGDNGFAVYRATPANTTITTLDSVGFVGHFSSVTIGADGLPIISYLDWTNGDLKVARCSNAFCAPYFRRR